MTIGVIRVWEEETAEGEEPLEWILLTSVPTTTLEQAWERVDWYRRRWLVEDYHHCLKSGCRIEERQLQPVDGLIRLLGLLSPLAVRLLQIRGYARCEPERPAHEVIEPLMLAVVAERSAHSPATMTIGSFWMEGACLGGYLARSHDGPASDGEPFGKAGSFCKQFLKAFTLLFISVRKMWVRIRLERQGIKASPYGA